MQSVQPWSIRNVRMQAVKRFGGARGGVDACPHVGGDRSIRQLQVADTHKGHANRCAVFALIGRLSRLLPPVLRGVQKVTAVLDDLQGM